MVSTIAALLLCSPASAMALQPKPTLGNTRAYRLEMTVRAGKIENRLTAQLTESPLRREQGEIVWQRSVRDLRVQDGDRQVSLPDTADQTVFARPFEGRLSPGAAGFVRLFDAWWPAWPDAAVTTDSRWSGADGSVFSLKERTAEAVLIGIESPSNPKVLRRNGWIRLDPAELRPTAAEITLDGVALGNKSTATVWLKLSPR